MVVFAGIIRGALYQDVLEKNSKDTCSTSRLTIAGTHFMQRQGNVSRHMMVGDALHKLFEIPL